MIRLRPAVLVVVAAVLLATGHPGSAEVGAARRQVSPEPSPSLGAVTTVAGGLVNPRGFAFAADGAAYVALAGVPGPTAGVVRVAGGCPVTVTGDFATTRVAFNGLSGVADVAFLPDGELYALVSGSDRPSGRRANGLYRVATDGEATLIADLSLWVEQNPVANRPPDYDSDGQPYAMSPLPGGDGFWVTEANSGQVLQIRLDGTIARVVDLSALDPIPTGIVAAADGGAYVSYFTRAPYREGAARVVHVAADGVVSDVWTDLSLPTAVEVGPDGELYALEMATGFGEDTGAPNGGVRPGTGRVVRRTGPDTAEPVVTGLALPAAMAFGPGGALYVSGPTVGADEATGTIIRVDLEHGGEAPIAVPSALPDPPACDPA